ncbi:unnamed protein product [Sphenostylis stenocarpa]|uniref:Uncharacterized protein n=1 Tax=Sphenostylis stenocarpa TaxID=92480 RepID=A0AA86TJ35_9FABA|nr:unnamed protein product [Sphenostylis stenocarpa]
MKVSVPEKQDRADRGVTRPLLAFALGLLETENFSGLRLLTDPISYEHANYITEEAS